MKYLGTIQDPKDLTTKEYVDDADTALSTRINTNEDNIAMAETDIESLQGDVNTLKTDNTSIKSAIQTLQDTYVPNTRKVNNKALDADITLSASDVGAITKVSPATEGNIPVLTTSGELTDSGKNISDIGIIAVFDSTTYEEIKEAYENNTPVICFYNANLTAGGKVEYRLHALTDETAIFVGMESVYPDLTVDFLLCSSSSEWTVDYAYLLPAAATEHKGDILMVNDVGDWQITDPPFLNAKVVTNISCPLSAWVSDTTTYTDYQFKANLTVAGATANYIPLVNFAPTEQESGNYIGATSGNGIVTIWCKNKPSGAITIPNIILTKEN